MGTEFQFWENGKVLETDGDDSYNRVSVLHVAELGT